MILRCFLSTLIAVGQLTSSQPVEKEEKHRVVVVGAGASGFTAAAALVENDINDVIVLEAADRIGGRIHTIEFGGQAIDKGAQFVHGEKGNIVFELVNPHNLITSYMPLIASEKELMCDVTGNKYNATLVERVMDEAFELLHGDYANSTGSVADYFYPKFQELVAAHSVEPKLGEAIRRLVTQHEKGNTPADDLTELGARGEATYVDAEGDKGLTWKPGTQGYKTIFDIISKKFHNPSEELSVKDKILFGKEVQRVVREEDSGEVVLSCVDGSSYRADHVIVTVSLGVLKKHAADMFQPPLPQTKTDAIRTIGIGCVGKVFLLFPTRWWPSEFNVIIPLFDDKQYNDFVANSTHGYWTGNTTGFYPVINHDRMLTVWFTGQSCRTMEQLTEEQVTEGLLELLDRLVGQSYQIPKPEAILRTNWASYNYTLGAYSFYTVEGDRLNVTRQQLAEPLMHGDKPVVMFAGEATNEKMWSTVHGAVETGRREAKRLIDYIRSQPAS